MQHLLNNQKHVTVQIGGGSVELKQFDTRYVLTMDEMRRAGRSSTDMAVATIIHGVEGEYTEDQILSMVPEDFKAVLDAIETFNKRFLPEADESDEEPEVEDDEGNVFPVSK